METKSKYLLINKAIFFPKEGILAFGDLHIGYEQMLKHHHGLSIPLKQLAETKKDVENILKRLKSQNMQVKRIVILGDIKHFFPYEKGEGFEVRDFLKFLEEKVGRKNLTLIKGNHDKIELGKKRYRNFYIKNDIAFVHGDKPFPQTLNKKVKYVVMGHLHPAIILKEGVKKEEYKAYLVGKWKGKELIVLPSFLDAKEGTAINGNYQDTENFSILTKKQLQDSKTFIVGKDKIYEYKKVKEIN